MIIIWSEWISSVSFLTKMSISIIGLVIPYEIQFLAGKKGHWYKTCVKFLINSVSGVCLKGSQTLGTVWGKTVVVLKPFYFSFRTLLHLVTGNQCKCLFSVGLKGFFKFKTHKYQYDSSVLRCMDDSQCKQHRKKETDFPAAWSSRSLEIIAIQN